MNSVKSVKYNTVFLRRCVSFFLAAVSLVLMLPAAAAEEASPFAGKLRISEIMAKNKASFTDELGAMPDYVEIENLSSRTIGLEGFGLADGADKTPWIFPDISLEAGAVLLLCADNENFDGEYLHTDFAISQGETLFLLDADGLEVDSALCSCGKADIALVRADDGSWSESFYPSPGYPNGPGGYDAWQESLSCASPLIINEAMVFNDSFIRQGLLGYCDWIEIKNVSGDSIELSDYWLSDDDDYLTQWRFPKKTLRSGQSVIVICDDSQNPPNSGYLKADFKLSAQGERLYLSNEAGLCDYVFLRDIPYRCSYGRISGENGWFFFDSPSPGGENGRGWRRVSAAPVSRYEDGVFENSRVKVDILGEGDIYYTTDGSVPDLSSPRFEKAFTLRDTTIVRAIAVQPGAMPSRPLTLSYIMDQGHSLPVLSLVTDDRDAFTRMYNNKRKDMEVPGSLSLYEEDGSFTIPCGIEMHGDASLSMPKKNMSVGMRGTYGQEMLRYDAFDGGVCEFTDFILRSGQDYPGSIVKNELLQNLCLQFSQACPTQRSKQCVLYVDGEYKGLYVLMEKLNEQFYASHYDVDPDSVTVIKARAPSDSSFYREVLNFAKSRDLRKQSAYEDFCEIVDIDSLIDWMIIEGYSANEDISNGNVRYCRSDEDDGKWRFMLYDMDSTMGSQSYVFKNVLTPNSTQCAQFITPLMENPLFRDRFLSRAAQVLSTTLSDENVVAELDRLAALIAPEVERDCKRFGRTLKDWEGSVETLRQRILQSHWSDCCVNNLILLFDLSDEEAEHYFG